MSDVSLILHHDQRYPKMEWSRLGARD